MTERQGTPIWFELTADDVDAAEAFYAGLLGWTATASSNPDHGGYRMARSGDDMVAGFMAPPMPGAPTGWGLYLAVDDADAAADRVRDLGGDVMFGPMDIPDVGRFVVVADPQGIVFSLMAGAGGDPSQAFKPNCGGAGDGHACWIELATPDPDGALTFYGGLFGWAKQGAMPMGGMGDYAFVGWADRDCPGAMMSSTATNAPPRWSVYFQVPDIDAAVARVRDADGTVLSLDEIPGGDFAANLTDPAGHAVGLVGPRKG